MLASLTCCSVLIKKLPDIMKSIAFACLLFFSSVIIAQNKRIVYKDERIKIAAEMENSIQTELLNKWYPQCVDSVYGGFLSTYTYDFKPTGPQDKMIVTQARHTWTNAKASELYPNVAYYKSCA